MAPPKPRRPPPPPPSVLRRVPWLDEDEITSQAYVNGQWVQLHHSLPSRLKPKKQERRNLNKRRSRSLDTGIAPVKNFKKGNQIDRHTVKSLQEEYRRSGKDFGRYKAKPEKKKKKDQRIHQRPERQRSVQFSRLNCSDCVKCLKYATISFALVFLVAGFFTISLGVWLLLGSQHVQHISIPYFDTSNIFKFMSYSLIGFGTALVLMSILGGVGAKRENQCMLTTFSVLLATTLFMELGCGTWVYKLFGDLEGMLAGGGLTGVSLTVIGLFLSTSMCCYVRKGRPRHIASVV